MMMPVEVDARAQSNSSCQSKRDKLPEYKGDIRSYPMFKKELMMCVAPGRSLNGKLRC